MCGTEIAAAMGAMADYPEYGRVAGMIALELTTFLSGHGDGERGGGLERCGGERKEKDELIWR